MSMSQEEIESLMNGLELEDDIAEEAPAVEETAPEPAAQTMSEDDINDLIAETDDITPNNEENEASSDSVDELLNSIDDSNQSVDNNDIDDILKELEANNGASEESAEEETNFDDILSTIDGISDDEPEAPVAEEVSIPEPVVEETAPTPEPEPVVEPEPAPVVEEVIPTPEPAANNNAGNEEELASKIQQGVFPLPVEEDTKVVNQLSAVANDSEEKATKIFDVLSNILDYNGDIQRDVQNLTEFNNKQIAMLESLNTKFPNIEAFKINLDQAKQMGNNISDINAKIEDGNMEIFQAMELMQFHDINRQKIERVMSVIRKLSTYLNNLFEDEGGHNEVAVAKHIHGDSTEDLLGDDDLESLIAEFGK